MKKPVITIFTLLSRFHIPKPQSITPSTWRPRIPVYADDNIPCSNNIYAIWWQLSIASLFRQTPHIVPLFNPAAVSMSDIHMFSRRPSLDDDDENALHQLWYVFFKLHASHMCVPNDFSRNFQPCWLANWPNQQLYKYWNSDCTSYACWNQKHNSSCMDWRSKSANCVCLCGINMFFWDCSTNLCVVGWLFVDIIFTEHESE